MVVTVKSRGGNCWEEGGNSFWPVVFVFHFVFVVAIAAVGHLIMNCSHDETSFFPSPLCQFCGALLPKHTHSLSLSLSGSPLAVGKINESRLSLSNVLSLFMAASLPQKNKKKKNGHTSSVC